jgi:hypothetical protein
MNIIITAVLLGVVWFFWSLFLDRKNESPKYSILKKNRGYELRKYKSYIVAEVTVPGGPSNPTGKAFRKLGGYIFGANKTRASIAMTSPVVTTKDKKQIIAMTTPVVTQQDKNFLTMSFMMPSRFTLKNLPIPDSKDINFKEIPEGKFAIISFSGWVSASKNKKKIRKLKSILLKENLKIIGEPQVLQYDRPTKFPLLRKNEIKIQIQ